MGSNLARDSRDEYTAEHMTMTNDTVVWNGPDGCGLTRLLVPRLEICDASPRSRHRVREHISAAKA